ncbi:ricin-type beta-trefoil lectin domain protein [Glycomyces luteolus]|uniref:Ricin-type beta-trefoil lectin domain protein n=1 Tax=Glycomyces luteolus TaxID=2670330 RepID=A0A9X3T2N7_9ACTN|nr:ricin-type beta-trefoil lectin domain protein [Glycomyces luteolus]MDA1358975.1 ricin-type beta-trefoil lectin domain protein [Glycomyces luteolus]
MAQRDPHLPRHSAGTDLPAKLREIWDKSRMRLGTGQAMAGVAAGVALVLTIAVVAAVMTAGGGKGDPEPAAANEPAATSPAATATPAASPSPSPSPSGSPTASASEEDEPEQPQDTAEEPTEAAPPAPAYPDDGWYQVKQEASGLCLSTGPEPGNEGRTVVVLAACGSANPSSIQVVAWDEGVYVFNLHFPDWSACMGADAPADQEGYLMAAYGCEFTETQFWELEPQGSGVYTIATSASGMCVGILGSRSATAGEPTATDTCDAGDATQRFTLS